MKMFLLHMIKLLKLMPHSTGGVKGPICTHSLCLTYIFRSYGKKEYLPTVLGSCLVSYLAFWLRIVFSTPGSPTDSTSNFDLVSRSLPEVNFFRGSENWRLNAVVACFTLKSFSVLVVYFYFPFLGLEPYTILK